MNLPNKITIIRIFFIPVFLIFLLAPIPLGEIQIKEIDIPIAHFIAAILFIIASTTDGLDGYYARKYNLVTDFGKFLDPLADKLLVAAALIALVELNIVPAWITVIILSREFAVTGLRLIAVQEGIVIAASNIAKWKTRIQIISISALLLHNYPFVYIGVPFDVWSLWIAMIITLYSGWDYFVKNKHVMLKSI
ncbi:CDP-diacylglycerol--glycerol-3-phosphate 3-phosphatidyltransferase [Salipaludibacillus neizhouensis]|uniref:CDP-diacylglycerol--glycerol-3-phosphate 3-phosphatidyltransferase n=1 Tax=Salipaludibacillus neizhouensis TaxID=885475 RepID=A0A3A9KIT0_9BACI|nr:CDP-diacylglycerol--glycerol-3-phosphate 3-phosphatidyltransferase [Salipaludibacillus neizhouensis]RKL64786.1 CDP-diacylglycerol--glycerol-3-phosphate 3-phosphatidyltransferase [Salipaludibacillus neizhouensis]